MNPLVDTVVGVLLTGFVGLVGAILLGQLVPARRLDRADRETEHWRQEAEKWRTAHDELLHTQARSTALLERSQSSLDLTDAMVRALRRLASDPGGEP